MRISARAMRDFAIAVALASTVAVWPAMSQTNSSGAGMSTAGAASQTTAVKLSRITEAIDEKRLLRISGNVHPLAQAKFDQGALDDAQPMDRMLLLLKRGRAEEAALRQVLEDQQTTNSPKHHAWLTPEQFGAQFGPSDADVQATIDWLTARGFHGVKAGIGRTVIEFSGTAGKVRDAFHTEIHRYVVKGAEHFANASDPQIPAALAPVVAGVVSLHNFPKSAHTHSLGTFQRSRETGAIEPMFSFGACGGGACNGIGPADLAKIYNIPANLDGNGQTIAVVGQSNINLQDAHDYRNIFGLPVNDPTIILNGPDPGLIAGDEGEADLDTQVSGAVAPHASIKFVVSETPFTGSTPGIDLSALYIVDNNIAGVLSESYGQCESALGTTGNAFYNALWEQAAAQGITVLVSTGDNGSAGCDNPNTVDFASGGLAVNGLSSTPFNVAVGGTDFSYTNASPSSVYWSATNGGASGTLSAKSYIPEIPWNDSCAAAGLNGCTTAIINADLKSFNDLVAASGGPSSVYAKPSWQSGITGMPSDNKRDTPDVSLFASNGQNRSFYIVCQKDATGTNSCDLNSPFTNFQGVGGTSASVQAFAGIMALINQSQATAQNPAPRQGNANYILYKLYKQNASKICTSNPATVSASSCIFYDIAAGNAAVACKGGTPNCSNTSTAANQYGVLANSGIAAWTATAGYDLATGLGTVSVANLAAAWATAGLTATTTAITASPSGTLAHGSNASFTVHVAASAGTPTGQISLIASPAGATQAGIGPFALSGGTATFNTNMLPGGTAYSIVAHYSGDGTFAQSDSAPALVTVNKESSNTTVGLVTFDTAGNITSKTAHTAAYGSPYIMRIDVSNASSTLCSKNLDSRTVPPINTIPCPTGNVTVTDNGAPLNDFTNTNTATASNVVPLNGQGYFEDQPIQLPAGNHSVVAAYAGDNSYTGSSSTADAIAISQATTNVAMTGPANAATNQPAILSANITTGSSGAAPTGTVTFTSGGTTLGTSPLVGTPPTTSAPAAGTATLSVTFTSTGTKSITATYSGDTNYAGSGPSTAFSVNVTPALAGGSFTVSGTPVTVMAGSSAVSTITITPGTGFTPGAIQVTCAGTGLPPGVTCSPNPLTITVPGTAPVSGQITVSVTGPTATLSASAITNDRALLSSGISLRPTARSLWWLWSAGAGLCGLLMAAFPWLGVRKRIRAALGLAVLAAVTFTIGCGGGGGSGGVGGGVATTHTSISVTTAKVPSVSNNFAFTITVTSSGAAPTGQAQLFDGSTALGLAAPITNGTVQINSGLGSVGTHSISAHYLGSATTAASASGALNLTVTGTTTLPLTTTPSGSGSVNLTIQ